MERYDYERAMLDDIREWLDDNYTEKELNELMQDRDSFEQDLNDRLWVEDSVTGNASGSYTFNTWEAEENICHNMDLLQDAMVEFGCTMNDYKGAEWADITIRCYLLGSCISQVLDELE